MVCTAIITEDGIDQIIEHGPGASLIIKREVADLKAMDIGRVYTKCFVDETAAYDWAEARTTF